MRLLARRGIVLAIATAASLAGFSALPGDARAGTYDVYACGGAAGGAQNAFATVSDPGMTAYNICPNTPSVVETGMVTRATATAGPAWVPYLAGAFQIFEAPAGASLASVTFDLAAIRLDDYWTVGIVAYDHDFNVVELPYGCYSFRPGCGIGLRSFFGPVTVGLNGHTKFRFETRCGNPGSCSIWGSGFWPATRALWSTANVTVRVQDSTPPSIAPWWGALWGEGWHRGYEEAWSRYQDNVGIMLNRVLVDGQVQGTQDYRDAGWPPHVRCNFTLRRPCHDLTPAGVSVDTRTLSDGSHALRVEAVDAAGNVGGVDRTIRVDNTAPAEVGGPHVVDGEGWRSANSFDVRWTNAPNQTAPITKAHFRLCTPGASPTCSTGAQAGSNIDGLTNVSVPAPGDYTLRVWVEDEAGNRDASNVGDPVHLRFDDVPPGRAELAQADGWLSARQAVAYDQHIGLVPGAVMPLSGIKGFSVTTDGSDPDGTLDVTGQSYRITELPEGVTTVKARAISGAGVASREVGSTRIAVDRSPPSVAAENAPDPERWQRSTVSVTLRGTDQANLSGMGAAPPEQPPEHGAYVAHMVDGGAVLRSRGARAVVSVSGDGPHSLTYHAADLAGNESSRHTIPFKIDATPPEVVAFEASDPRDPRRLSVVVWDSTSGIAGGTIEMRRSGRGTWSPLQTSLDQEHLSAYIDDLGRPDGTYEFRARAQDQAGNERVSDRRRDGSKKELALPLRLASRITLSARAVKMKRCRRGARKHRRRCRKRNRLCRRRPASCAGRLRPLRRIRLKRARTIHGLLTTAEGRPIARAPVDVTSRARTAAAFKRVATRRSDALGRFTYRARGGPSRTVRFRYRGTALVRPAVRDLAASVPARTTITASDGFVQNGRRVRFSGRLLGRPLPHGGKLIDLQAHYRRRWRTFATPRTTSAGRWRYRYRFEATRGLVTYRFRARIRRETAYPYELGYSRVVRVTVRGR